MKRKLYLAFYWSTLGFFIGMIAAFWMHESIWLEMRVNLGSVPLLGALLGLLAMIKVPRVPVKLWSLAACISVATYGLSGHFMRLGYVLKDMLGIRSVPAPTLLKAYAGVLVLAGIGLWIERKRIG